MRQCLMDNIATNKTAYFIKRHLLIWSLLATLLGCSGEAPVRSWVLADYGVYDATLSADGRFALVATVDHAALLWDLPNNNLLHTWQHTDGADSEIILTAMSGDGRFALTAERRRFAVWSVQSGQTARYWQLPDDILAITLADSGRFALAGLRDATARYIDLKTGATAQTFDHDAAIQAVAIAANNRFVITGSADWTARVWNIASGALLRTFQHDFQVDAVALSPGNRYAFTSAGQYDAKIWDLRSGAVLQPLYLRGEFLHKISPANMTIDKAVFSADERWLFTSSPPRFVRQWDVNNGRLVQEWALPKRTAWKPAGGVIYNMVLTPDGRYLVVASADGTTHAFDLQK